MQPLQLEADRGLRQSLLKACSLSLEVLFQPRVAGASLEGPREQGSHPGQVGPCGLLLSSTLSRSFLGGLWWQGSDAALVSTKLTLGPP